jgi:hypothetical protein
MTGANVPEEILVATNLEQQGKFNDHSRDHDDEESTIDLVGKARAIEAHKRQLALQELQERDRLMEEARVAEEERELYEAEEKGLRAANSKKKATNKKSKPTKKTNDDNDDDDDDDENATKATKSRGPNFSLVEDVLICQAYIAASEDPIVGNKSGSADFSEKLADMYRVLVGAHVERERLLWKNKERRGSNASSSDVEEFQAPAFSFIERNGVGLWRRYRVIGHDCIKLFGIEETHQAKSGENQQILHDRHMEIWKMRTQGNKSFCFWPCAEYLRNKQKWKSVLIKDDGNKAQGASVETVKIERPVGKKKATKDKERRELVQSIAKSAISEYVEEKLVVAKKAKKEINEAGNVFAEQRHQFLAEASACLKIFLQDAAMEKLMAKATTPDKAEWQKKQAAIAMAEMEKRSMQSMLAMEENELRAIAELKLKLELVEKQRCDNLYDKENRFEGV